MMETIEKRQKVSMPLTRVVGKVPGMQQVLVRNYLTHAFLLDKPVTANEMVEKLGHAMEIREAGVYGISVENGVLVFDICE